MEKILDNFDTIISDLLGALEDVFHDNFKQLIVYNVEKQDNLSNVTNINIMVLTDLSEEEIDMYSRKVGDYIQALEAQNDFSIIILPIIQNINAFEYYCERVPFCNQIKNNGMIFDRIIEKANNLC